MEFFKHDGDKRKRILSEYDYGVPAHNPGVRVFKSAGPWIVRGRATPGVAQG